MHLSPRTVETYLEQLKATFGCCSKAVLIERAIAEGYGNFMPASLLQAEFP